MIGEPTALTIALCELVVAGESRCSNGWKYCTADVATWLERRYGYERLKSRRIARILTNWMREYYVPAILIDTPKLP